MGLYAYSKIEVPAAIAMSPQNPPTSSLRDRQGLLWIIATAFTSILVTATCSLSHPHVFIDYSVTVMFNEDGLADLKIRWVFDEMFSEQTLAKYPSSRSGKLSSGDISAIRRDLFDSLKEYQYFTMMKLDGKYYPVTRTEGFWAEIRNGKLSFTYVVPCNLKASNAFKLVKILVCDEEYYNDCEFAKKSPVLFVNDGNYEHSFEIKEDQRLKYYFGQVVPKVLTFKFRRKQ